MGVPKLKYTVNGILCLFDIKRFFGKNCAVDISSWLSKSIYVYKNTDFCDARDTTLYIDYCVKKLMSLKAMNINPIVVFDGAKVPAKKMTHDNRSERKQELIKRSINAKENGDTDLYTKLRIQSSSVGFRAVTNLIKVLERMNVDYVVAPYEADAQISKMFIDKEIDFVITEDSDFIIYGCENICFGFEIENITGDNYINNLQSTGMLYESSKLLDPSNNTIIAGSNKLNKLRFASVISQCDYYDGIPGIGISSALKIINAMNDSVSHYFDCINEDHVKILITRVVSSSKRCSKNIDINDNDVIDKIVRNVMVAFSVFNHHVVWDRNNLKLTNISRPSQFSNESLESFNERCMVYGDINSPLMSNFANMFMKGLISPIYNKFATMNDFEKMTILDRLSFVEKWASVMNVPCDLITNAADENHLKESPNFSSSIFDSVILSRDVTNLKGHDMKNENQWYNDFILFSSAESNFDILMNRIESIRLFFTNVGNHSELTNNSKPVIHSTIHYPNSTNAVSKNGKVDSSNNEHLQQAFHQDSDDDADEHMLQLLERIEESNRRKKTCERMPLPIDKEELFPSPLE